MALGRDGLERLPSPDQLAQLPATERYQLLDGLRGELYGVTSIIADRSAQRAWQERSSFPPYGLVRSLFSQLRVVADNPGPFEQGSIGTFADLGRAFLDTVVFHLEREMAAMRTGELVWVPERLEHLLALHRVDAGRTGQARIRDPLSFLYGGLHFGASLCVQMVEVMTRLLDGNGNLKVGEKVEVMGRSIRAPYQVAAVNLYDVPAVYGQIHGTPNSSSPWLSADSFVVPMEDGRPRRIDLRPGLVVPPSPGAAEPARPADGPPRYTTRGCPARNSVSGGQGAIAILWSWCIDLAAATGLIADG